jgi:hypothetical protein
MITPPPIPAPCVTTILPDRITVQRLRIVRTCDGCGTSSQDPAAGRCGETSCPLRHAQGASSHHGLDHERLIGASLPKCHHSKTARNRVSCLKTEHVTGAND